MNDYKIFNVLTEFSYRKKMEVILIHMSNTSPALLSCATQHHCFTSLTTRLPRIPKVYYKLYI